MRFEFEGQLGKTSVLAGIVSFIFGLLNFNIFAPLIFGICIYIGTFLVILGFLAIMDVFSVTRKSVAFSSVAFLLASGTCFASALVLPVLDLRVQMTYAFWCLGFHYGQFIYSFPISPVFFPLLAAGIGLCVAGIATLMFFKQ